MFPFLIGRIRTNKVFKIETGEFYTFPFLIGRIRTV